MMHRSFNLIVGICQDFYLSSLKSEMAQEFMFAMTTVDWFQVTTDLMHMGGHKSDLSFISKQVRF